jgi:fibronectin type 3 domain-containing protein
VRARDAAGNWSLYSPTTSATTLDGTPPTAPTSLAAATAGSSQIDLSWVASTDNVAVTSYSLERCQGVGCSSFAPVAAPTGTSYSDTGLAADTSYSYRVRATDAAGNWSPYSNGATAVTEESADTTAPTAPGSPNAVAASASQIDLSWTASTDAVGVTGYSVERCQGAGCSSFSEIAAPAATGYGDTGLTDNTSYSYRVRARDAAGNWSLYSPTTSATTPDGTPPTTPTSLAASTADSSQINLSWVASTDNVAVTGYSVERCQGVGCVGFAPVAAPTGTSYSNTGLAANTSYSYRVRATDAVGNWSSYSSVATAVTAPPVDTTPPTSPSSLNAVAASSSQISLSWTASTDAIGVSGYQVERCQGAGCASFVQVATPSGTTYIDAQLATATNYSYRVRATDAAGNLSNYSNIASTTTFSPPTAGLVAAYGFETGTGTAVTDASGNGNSGVINGATWTTQGKFGNALSFNGTNNLVAINSSATLNVTTAMTLEAWINPAANQSGWRTIMQREVDAYFLNASNDSGALRPSGGGTLGGQVAWLSGPTANPVNIWTHVALTYDGAALRLYVNGVQAATLAATGAIETNSSPLRIGGNSPYGEYFNGRIDEVRVYNRALSATEIQTDMNTPVAGPN